MSIADRPEYCRLILPETSRSLRQQNVVDLVLRQRVAQIDQHHRGNRSVARKHRHCNRARSLDRRVVIMDSVAARKCLGDFAPASSSPRRRARRAFSCNRAERTISSRCRGFDHASSAIPEAEYRSGNRICSNRRKLIGALSRLDTSITIVAPSRTMNSAGHFTTVAKSLRRRRMVWVGALSRSIELKRSRTRGDNR